ncbi:MAG: hypothetical protein FGM33_02180 [Candidatus Kapabacteria bacterium]|nr:hypothetical protein [Candidatus Kapabacteria bacterium]
MKYFIQCSLPLFGRGLGSSVLPHSLVLLFVTVCRVMADVSVHTIEPSTTLSPGTVMSIRWTNDLEAANVDVVLWDGVRRTVHVLAEGLTEENTQLVWTIPAGIEDGSRYRIMVRDTRQPDRAMSSVGFLTFQRAAPMPTSTPEAGALAENIQVAPMPASDRVRVAWNMPIRHIELIDVHGSRVKVVDPVESAQGCSIDISDLSIGTYTVQAVSTSGKRFRRPLIINR